MFNGHRIKSSLDWIDALSTEIIESEKDKRVVFDNKYITPHYCFVINNSTLKNKNSDCCISQDENSICLINSLNLYQSICMEKKELLNFNGIYYNLKTKLEEVYYPLLKNNTLLTTFIVNNTRKSIIYNLNEINDLVVSNYKPRKLIEILPYSYSV